MNKHWIVKHASLTALALTLMACGNENSSTPPTAQLAERSYRVEVTNLTAGQPFSPLVVAAHTGETGLLRLGEPASVALEQLAEGGDNGPLLAALADDAQVFDEQGGAGILMPGASEALTLTLMLSEEQLADIQLSGVTMLVNTNDAISALTQVDVTTMALDDSITLMANVYDAGTEANTETADSLPGPAAAGGAQQGFDATRDDVIDQVLVHPGVLTQDDGLSSSVLHAGHRFDNPAMRVVITRTQ